MVNEPAAPRLAVSKAGSRATRSEVASTAPQPGGRATRGSRQASVESTGSTGSRQVANRRSARNKGPEANLEAVTEASPATKPTVPAAVARTSAAYSYAASNAVANSPGVASNLSGPTAHSNQSDSEQDSLDPDLILTEIAQLHHAASALLEATVPHLSNAGKVRSLLEDYRKPTSRVYKVLQQRNRALALQRAVFGAALPGQFIRSRSVVQVIQGTHMLDSGAIDIIVEVISTANLAELTAWLLTSREDGLDHSNYLKALDGQFPSPFLNASEIGNGASNEETFDLGLALRTQVALAKLESKNDSAHNVLLTVFFSELGDPSKTTLKGWKARGPEGNEQIPAAYEQKVQARIENLHKAFANDGESIDFATLAHEYPWRSFVTQALAWIKKRNGELTQTISARGGVDAILTSVESDANAEVQKVQNPVESTNLEKKAENPKVKRSSLMGNSFLKDSINWVKQTTPRVTPSKSKTAAKFDKDATSFIKSAEKPHKSSKADLPAEVSAPVEDAEINVPEPPPEAEQPPVFSDPIEPDMEEEQSVPGNPATDYISKRLSQLKQRDAQTRPTQDDRTPATQVFRKPRFVDPQVTAERVEFDTQVDQAQAARAAVGRKAGRNKRPAEPVEEEEEVSEDEGFQRDSRNVNPQERRRAAPAPAPAPRRTASPPKRPRLDAAGSSTAPAPAPINMPVVGSRLANTPAPSTAGASYAQVRMLARDMNQLAPRKVQVRAAWTPEETNKLIEYIEQYGCAWAKIKEIDGQTDGDGHYLENAGVLANRDQVSLKDKARNMRFDYHKAQVPLPRNFDAVTMSRTQVDRLRALGVM